MDRRTKCKEEKDNHWESRYPLEYAFLWEWVQPGKVTGAALLESILSILYKKKAKRSTIYREGPGSDKMPRDGKLGKVNLYEYCTSHVTMV